MIWYGIEPLAGADPARAAGPLAEAASSRSSATTSPAAPWTGRARTARPASSICLSSRRRPTRSAGDLLSGVNSTPAAARSGSPRRGLAGGLPEAAATRDPAVLERDAAPGPRPRRAEGHRGPAEGRGRHAAAPESAAARPGRAGRAASTRSLTASSTRCSTTERSAAPRSADLPPANDAATPQLILKQYSAVDTGRKARRDRDARRPARRGPWPCSTRSARGPSPEAAT